MQTMHPVVLHGSTAWDQERLPRDEFNERLQSIQEMMRQNEINGLIVYSDCRDYARLCYITNYIPKHSWAIVLIPVHGKPRLLAKVAGSRDIPSVSVLTWIDDIKPAQNITGEIELFVSEVAEDGQPVIGICGKAEMRHTVYTEIAAGCQGNSLKDMDIPFDQLLRHKRPREISVMREASGILKSVVEAMKEIQRRGGSVVTTAVEAERVARYLGAHDVRVLYSTNHGKTLEPFETLSDVRNDRLVSYVAVECLGYWVEAMVTLSQQASPIDLRAAELLQFLTQSLKPGAKVGDLVHQAEKMAQPYQLHPLLQNGFGHSIGLSIVEAPLLHASRSENKVEAGTVYSLHAGLTDNKDNNVLLSSMMLVTENGNEILWSSVGQ